MKKLFILFFWFLASLSFVASAKEDGFWLFHPNSIFAQQSLNQQPLAINANQYSFILIRHLYGSPNTNDPYPASTFLANQEKILAQNSDFMLLMGDVVQSSDQFQVNYFQNLISNYPFPVFNTLGNHELSADQQYFKQFSNHTQTFTINNDLFLLINTGQDSNLTENDIDLITNTLSNTDKYDRIFIVAHRLFWLDQHPELASLQDKTNNEKLTKQDENLSKLITSLIPQDKEIYYFAGDIGVPPTPPLLYFSQDHQTYLATGIGETNNDYAVQVSVDHDQVNFQLVPLSEQKPESIEKYSPEYWQKIFTQLKNETVTIATPSIIQRIITLPGKLSFWAGITLGSGLILTSSFLSKKMIK